jgi:hypothetical protein
MVQQIRETNELAPASLKTTRQIEVGDTGITNGGSAP